MVVRNGCFLNLARCNYRRVHHRWAVTHERYFIIHNNIIYEYYIIIVIYFCTEVSSDLVHSTVFEASYDYLVFYVNSSIFIYLHSIIIYSWLFVIFFFLYSIGYVYSSTALTTRVLFSSTYNISTFLFLVIPTHCPSTSAQVYTK